MALCPRVVVIDKGQLIHDGDLRGADPAAPARTSGSRCASPAAAPARGRRWPASARWWRPTACGPPLQVKADQVAGVVGACWRRSPVTDLTVEDPPLEEVMKELFSRGKAEAAGAPAV